MLTAMYNIKTTSNILTYMIKYDQINNHKMSVCLLQTFINRDFLILVAGSELESESQDYDS